MFEMLDEERTGMITALSLKRLLTFSHKFKSCGFDYAEFEKQGGISKDLKLDNSDKELKEFVKRFDLTNDDGLISPEEFYNIVMAIYENK
jgi:Ca2+-binding EF-hand superfamily protein